MPLSQRTEFVLNIQSIIPTTAPLQTPSCNISHTTKHFLSFVVKTPYSPVSQISDTFLLVHIKTKIMVFKENYS